MNKPFIPMDSDSFIPGKPPFSPAELHELRKQYESSSPSQPGPRKQVADIINDEPAPVAKADPVVPDKEIGHFGTFTRIKKEKVAAPEKNIGTTIRKVRKVKR
jgi:hypothetical protein